MVASLEPEIANTSKARRFLICSGVAHYKELKGMDLPGVKTEISAMADLMCGLKYDQVLPVLTEDPTSITFKKELTAWLTNKSKEPDDLLIFYHTGHGFYDGDKHYLLLSDSRLDNLGGTAIKTEDIAEWILKPPKFKQAMIILDTCNAGQGGNDFAATASRIASSFRTQYVSSGIWTLVAARTDDSAVPNLFIGGFADAVRNKSETWGGGVLPFLAPESLVDAVNQSFRKAQTDQGASLNLIGGNSTCVLFPNSKFNAHIPPLVDKEAQRTYVNFPDYWTSLSLGGEIVPASLYFSGRETALAETVSWLKDSDSPQKVKIITGRPGTGKSAMLARLITLSRLDYPNRATLLENSKEAPQDTIPPEEIISAIISVRGRTLRQIVQIIGEQLGIPNVANSELLLKALSKRDMPLVIVVDALDEAEEPTVLVSALLEKLATLPRIRLLIGSRPFSSYSSDLAIPGLSTSDNEINLDLQTYLGPRDMVNYVASRLRCDAEPTKNSSYRGKAELVEEVAEAVAAKAGNNFLVARIVTTYLIDEEVPLESRMEFPQGVHEAFDRFLDSLDRLQSIGLDKEKAKHLLRPLAYAEGQGLPRERIWVTLAGALADRDYDDDDIQNLLTYAGAYVVETREADRSVYRLYHSALAEYLRKNMDLARVESIITAALVELTPSLPNSDIKDWRTAHPYVKMHLASHAAAAKQLDTLVKDPLFLIAADKLGLLAVLDSVEDPEAVEAAHVYRLAVRQIDCDSPELSASYLGMAACQQSANTFIKEVNGLPLTRSWVVDWAWWQYFASHLVLGTHDHWVNTVAIGSIRGRVKVVSGGRDGALRIWDPANSESHHQLPRNSSSSVNTITIGDFDGRCMVLAGTDDGSIEFWDLESESSYQKVLRGHDGPVNSVAMSDINGRTTIASCGNDGTVRLWSTLDTQFLLRMTGFEGKTLNNAQTKKINQPIILAEGSSRSVLVWEIGSGEPHRILMGHNGPVNALAVGNIRGASVLVTGGTDATVRLWNYATGLPAGKPLTHILGRVSAVAIQEVSGRSIVAAGGLSREIVVWDLSDTDEPSMKILSGHNSSITALTTGVLQGTSVLVSAGLDRTIRVWDLAEDEPRGRILAGHDRPVNALAVGAVHNRASIVSGSSDGTVRLWNSVVNTRKEQRTTSYHRRVNSISIGEVDKRLVIASGGDDRTVRLFDLASGVPYGRPLTGHHARVGAVAIAKAGEDSIVVSGGLDQALIVWYQPVGDEPHTKVLSGHDGSISTVAIGIIKGQSVVVSASLDSTVRVWNLSEEEPRGRILAGHDGTVNAVAVNEVRDQSIIVSAGDDGTIRLWELITGEPLGEALTGHKGKVSSVALGTMQGRPVIVSAGADGTVRKWDLTDMRKVTDEILMTSKGDINAVGIANIGKHSVVVSGGNEGVVYIRGSDGAISMDIKVGSIVHCLALAPYASMVIGCAMGLLALTIPQLLRSLSDLPAVVQGQPSIANANSLRVYANDSRSKLSIQEGRGTRLAQRKEVGQ